MPPINLENNIIIILGNKMAFNLNETAYVIAVVFAIAAIGYIIGRIQICGISLGTAAIFIAGLIFGYMGFELPIVLETTGLVLFITSVGLSAGPGFLDRLKQNGAKYVALCLSTAAIGAVIFLCTVKLVGIDSSLAAGIMTGAFTSSPGFAAAKEAVGAAESAKVAAGYGLVYPVGAICKVLMIQIIPRLLNADMAKERKLIAVNKAKEDSDKAQIT